MSPSRLVEFVRSLPRLDAGLGASGDRSFRRASASLRDEYSASVIVFPLLLNCLLALPVALALLVLLCRPSQPPALSAPLRRRRDLLVAVVACGLLVFVGAHLLWLGRPSPLCLSA